MAPIVRRRRAGRVPERLTTHAAVVAAEAALPTNYQMEIPKVAWRIEKMGAKRVALQLPEGLLMYGCVLADALRGATGAEVVVMADVTYGACCVDDFTAKALGADLLVHYGHSCLVPVSETDVATMYVFVSIAFDAAHLAGCVAATFPKDARLVLAGTVQFVGGLSVAEDRLRGECGHAGTITVPQARPLSAAEVLGCTAPTLAEGSAEALVFVADGRFHLEAMMIANSWLPAYRYDPYHKVLTRERYETERMRALRRKAIDASTSCRCFGLILGTLGRQGNPGILRRVRDLLEAHGRTHFTLLLSEITPQKLARFGDQVGAFVQVACPRLSIDWGHDCHVPLLTPYEVHVALGAAPWAEKGVPMDFYSADGGVWGNAKNPRGTGLRAPEAEAGECCGSGGGEACGTGGCS